ncbi:hypothetical protein [Marinobacterium sediminicola]|uniref:Uncharacterized protein n=1 Tax=Marinobacterium sediminicola TaxID=518898 RepID=A0ABY1RWP9_9GAMM|nr:hypothetical protein [Marinobacterium sediminicola]ULG70243.1 hypothetical protein LN244_05370 [Marinobacterium sediminicola]SMR69978.1 hypothetical protein SAMN04487964_101425 [Marinobacterium sediminicola]
MPSRSTRVIFSRRCQLLCVCLLGLGCSVGLMAEQPIPYKVTSVDQFSTGRVHGRDVYEGKDRGNQDWEPMNEVSYADNDRQELPVQVVHPSEPPPVQQVVVQPERKIVLAGEDKIFDRIRLDLDIQRCIFQNICTDEVKAIPGGYMGDDQEEGGDWTGRADAMLEMISEGGEAEEQLPEGPGNRAPGRVFVEEPAKTP